MEDDDVQEKLSSVPESMEVTTAAANSDSEDSESDSDSEAQDKLQVEALESELYSNPSNYDAHVQVSPPATSFFSDLQFWCSIFSLFVLSSKCLWWFLRSI